MNKILALTLIFCLVPIYAFTHQTDQPDLVVVGAVEMILLTKEDIQLPARIDTGAKTSSLSAIGIQPFERDGKKWIRFQVKNHKTEKLVEIERPLAKTVKIKQHGALASERFVVSLQVAIGAIKHNCEFSLIDRSDYEYPALIGRNFLSKKLMVDVSREYVIDPLNQGEKSAN
jgi:hypothetical protein